MPQFTKTLNTSIGECIFYFTRIYTVHGLKYHVSVHNDVAYHFMLSERNGSWIIDREKGALPPWIIDMEEQLGQTLLDHLRGE